MTALRYALRLAAAAALLLGLALGSTERAHATASIAQTCTGTVAATTSNATCTLTPTSGNLLVAVLVSDSVNPNNWTNTTGTGGCNGTFASKGSAYNDPAGVAFYTFTANASSSCTVTLNTGGASGSKAMYVYEIAGWDGTTAVDSAFISFTGSSTSLTGSMNATSVAVDVLIGVIEGTNGGANVPTFTTAQSGFTADLSIKSGNINSKTEKQITSTSGTYTAGWSTIGNASSRTLTLGAIGIKGVASTPTIASVSAGPWLQGATVTLNGSNFEASQGTGHVDCGTASHTTAQTVTSWGATAINITIDKGNTQFGVAWPCTVTTNGSGASNTYAGITALTPPSGTSYVNIGTLWATASQRITTTSTDLTSGDQCAYDNATAVVAVDGSWQNTVAGMPFNVYCWNAAAFNWGSAGSQSFTAPVVTGSPAAFGFFR